MKKIFLLPLIVASIFVFSGCGPALTTTKTQQYNFSESIWKTTDAGATWNAKTVSNQKPTVSDLDILQIAINPTDASNIYVGLKSGGMIKSTDGGEHWDITNFISDKVYGLAINPSSPQTLYVSGVWQGRGKIFKTENAGTDWKEIYTTAANGPLVVSLTLDQKNSDTIYATTSGNEVIKSVDGGSSWQNIYRADNPVLKVAIDRADSNLIYFLDQNGKISKSADGGKTITTAGSDSGSSFSSSFNGSYLGGNFSVILTDPNNANWVYAAGGGGIMRSKDAGKTWEKVVALDNPETYPITALAINPANSNEMFYGAGQAVYKSVDGGKNWSTFQFTTKKKINTIQYDPQNPANIYLGLSK